MTAFPTSKIVMALVRQVFLICVVGRTGLGIGSSISSDDSAQGVSSHSSPLAVVGIMASPAGAVAAERRDAAWESWADLKANSPHLVEVNHQIVAVVLN